jgi:hypothetical protein
VKEHVDSAHEAALNAMVDYERSEIEAFDKAKAAVSGRAKTIFDTQVINIVHPLNKKPTHKQTRGIHYARFQKEVQELLIANPAEIPSDAQLYELAMAASTPIADNITPSQLATESIKQIKKGKLASSGADAKRIEKLRADLNKIPVQSIANYGIFYQTLPELGGALGESTDAWGTGPSGHGTATHFQRTIAGLREIFIDYARINPDGTPNRTIKGYFQNKDQEDKWSDDAQTKPEARIAIIEKFFLDALVYRPETIGTSDGVTSYEDAYPNRVKNLPSNAKMRLATSGADAKTVAAYRDIRADIITRLESLMGAK